MDIIGRLFSLIPVLLLIFAVIRFIERARRRKRAMQQTGRRGLAKGETPASRPGKSVRRGGTLPPAGEPSKLASRQGATFSKAKKIAEFVNRAKKAAPLDLLDSLLSSGEEARSDKPDRLSEEKPIAVPDSPEQGERIVEDRATSAEPPTIPAGRSPLDAIRARSPLAQAMLWKIVFDRPSALRGPDEELIA